MSLIDLERHPLADPGYRVACRDRLAADGALVLSGLVPSEVIDAVVADADPRVDEAFFADSTHNVYLTDPDPDLSADHPFNRQVASSKGLIADDQIPADSPLRTIYADAELRAFLCVVLGIDSIHPYADALSSINVHFAPDGRELGWHFDNSSFAVTMLLRAPQAGGRFEYVAGARDSSAGEQGYDTVAAVLDGAVAVDELRFEPGDLVLFRGRDALHRVTPTEGATTRLLVVFAFNDEPGVRLSDSALATFYGRDT
ncbi:MAG: 2OG-Fe(II) oxygenase [Actinomycetota bacterium]